MPTALPRLSVTVTQAQSELLAELARLQHRSASSFLRELLDVAEPTLRAVLPVLRARTAALAAQPEALENAAQEALQAILGGDPRQADLIEHIAALVGSGAEREGDSGRPHRSDSEERTDDGARSDPPSCNYGGQV